MIKHIFILCASLLALFSCSSKPDHRLKVVATPVPHAQMLEFAKEDLKAQGIDLKIIVTQDYNMPNRALAQKDVDANFFQHLPFLEEQVRQFHYPIESYGAIELEPMGVYSKKFKSLSDIPDNALIAVPNDPSNEGRALILLQGGGLITLKDPQNSLATVLDIQSNPKQLRFIEVDAAMLPRSLSDVDAAVINTNFALEANLNPDQDALLLENKDSPYVNVLAIRKGDENRPDLIALQKAMTSEKMREFIENTYKGAVLPAF